jgi:hypothetical protein
VPVGPGLGTTNSDSPRWTLVRSGSVRASSMRTSARAPNVHQVFTPLTSQPPSVFVAVTLIRATSDPKSGSVTATAAMASALARRGSHDFFCSSVPPLTSARVRISGRVMSEPPTPSEPRDSSSVATTMPM